MRKEKISKKSKKSDAFTATEVGTLLESMEKNIKQIAEGHSGLALGLKVVETAVLEVSGKLNTVEVKVHGNSRRLDMMDVSLSNLNHKVDCLEDAVSLVRKELGETREDLNGKINGFRQELKEEIQGVRQELKSEIKELGQELGTKIDELGTRLATVETPR